MSGAQGCSLGSSTVLSACTRRTAREARRGGAEAREGRGAQTLRTPCWRCDNGHAMKTGGRAACLVAHVSSSAAVRTPGPSDLPATQTRCRRRFRRLGVDCHRRCLPEEVQVKAEFSQKGASTHAVRARAAACAGNAVVRVLPAPGAASPPRPSPSSPPAVRLLSSSRSSCIINLKAASHSW